MSKIGLPISHHLIYLKAPSSCSLSTGTETTLAGNGIIRDEPFSRHCGSKLLRCRAGMVEHHRRALTGMMALYSANAPISAARLLDRCQAHVLEALAWSLDSSPPPALHAYAAILWHCTPLLLPRLDISQRMALCQVRFSPAFVLVFHICCVV